MATFPNYKQPDSKDCGPTCLRIIAKHYGKLISLQEIRKLSETTRAGSNLLKLSDAAEEIGFKTIGAKLDFKRLEHAQLPLIVHWDKNHFVVVYRIKNGKVYISDPGYGLIILTNKEFVSRWIGNNATEESKEGITLLLEPTSKFKKMKWTKTDKRSLGFLFQYLFKYKNLLVQLSLGLLVGSLLQLIFPFLTQSIVDVGIQNQDIGFIYLILIAQIMLFLGRTSVEVFRSWILLHLSTRVNISLVSDFFIKLMNLPISFFDTRMTGDIMQRIGDHRRIENLLTGTALNTFFSFFNLFVFGAVLIYYSPLIFLIFIGGSVIYILWILFFLKRRKELDYMRFAQLSQEQSTVIELINGMQEIKLHNAETQKRWKWEFVQARLFHVSIKTLALEQSQGVGSSVINELKNILVTFASAILVIEGQLTLGMMLSLQYIIGQLNGPIMGIVTFVRTYQDAKISLERLNEIHDKEDEESRDAQLVYNIVSGENIKVTNLSFRYMGAEENVLKELNLIVPAKKITAIVGASGCGKTTLMKLLLKFYEPAKGEIHYGRHDFKSISPRSWRDHCGVVMQEGYVFNDTIAANIAVGEEVIDLARLVMASQTANIYDFVQSLPLRFNTKIGNEGVGISTGQKQRLFIARAVYKNPEILFFDEATSALDAKNERIVMENLNRFLKGKTVFIIAHRLSTVKNADKIIVMDEGEIKEAGTHEELVLQSGVYYNLVKNQLELGKIREN
ncbi:ATP-binding cassette subfamily B protein [Algoriphagus ratkowskyi]|uniref:ATP-binding cassette subfamily B protein n=1 Tax=Algoriphagus ratkowskyi TaxID=57028 RepID=A0A2W7RW06_9BACT|nr:peptidase domain-containing ABC transporter [Algoriphagus ratkowskyi]PZX59387.1 ATP-binding cassette subfamily B protein [Algoriphagus ratkowskyi]TXD77350.1 peptidase domain-containing ABC transporter [Algoriphagus ratkowskyi]